MIDEAWALSGSVALRPEPFGALAYDFASRRLSFLKSPDLVAVVRRLDGTATVREAFTAVGLPESRWPAYLDALESLAGSRMLTNARPTPLEESA